MEKRDRQELIFNLITEIDDFKHLSTKMYVTFIDFADAFGSVSHEFIFESLEKLNIPETYLIIIKDLYNHSCFQVIGRTNLSKIFYIIRGTKTGDPLSAIIFIIVIDCIFKPMVSVALVNQNIENEKMLNPLPVQGFADDIAMVTHDERTLHQMISVSEPIMLRANLDVKASKCAVLYGRRSGNNWYTGKRDKKPNVVVQNKNIKVLKRDDSYEYLGKLITINGDDSKQVDEIIDTYKEQVEKVCQCMLPLSFKVCALNNMALAKVLHFFCNTRFQDKLLVEIDKFLTNKVRDLFNLYQSTTRDVIYLSRLHGGIGVKQFSTTYYCTRVSFIVKMLNHNEETFKNIARESLKLDMKKRCIKTSNSDNNFLGFEVNHDGFLVSETNFGCKTEWMELNRYCKKLNVKLQWLDDRAIVIFNNKPCNASNLNKALFEYALSQLKLHAGTLSLQGAFLQIQYIDEKISNTIHYNWKLNDYLLIFCVKARLNILPTNFTCYIWNRDNNPRCPFCNHSTESIAHLLNGCHREFGNFYSKRHNRIVNHLYDELKLVDRRYKTYNNKNIETILPEHREMLVLCNCRKPDIVRYDPVTRNIEIIEITICYDLYFDQARNGKYEKYVPLVNILENLGFNVKMYVLCFGSLGNVTKECSKTVRKLYKIRSKAKSILKWCSISIIIGANYIWRNRVKKLLM